MRKMRVVVLTVLMLGIFSIGAYAQTNEDAPEVKMDHMTIYPMTSSSAENPLDFISDSIIDSGDYLTITSMTVSDVTCENLKLVINVQKYSNGSWSTVKTFTFSKDNTFYINEATTYSDISSNTKYRLTTYHYATLDSKTYMDINYSAIITTD